MSVQYWSLDTTKAPGLGTPVPKDELRLAKQYLTLLSRLFRLEQWKISLHREFTSSPAAAETYYISIIQTARIWLGTEFVLYSPGEKADTLIHEMLHVVFSPLDAPVASAKEALDKRTRKVVQETWRLAMEGTVDNLSRSLRPLFPLYPK